MANSIPRDFIDRLIDDSDIVAVISNYVSLTKKGNNFTCCCPFHDEKTPSFSVSPQKSIYHCFGCGKGGNVLSFIMDFEGLNFVEAVERLADMNNISVPREASSGRNDFSKIYELNELVANAYFSALKKEENKKIVEYLKDRGISGTTAKNFKIGYADFNQYELLDTLKKKFSEKEILDSGNFLKNEKGFYPFLRNRVTFPIQNSSGKFIGFGGRVIDDSQPKYLNSKDSKFFNKTRELYSFNNAKKDQKSDSFIVTEGYMDVVMLSEHGVNNAVAALGTAFSQNHINSMFKMRKKIIFCFDSDEAGLKAAWRALQISLKNVFDDRTVRFLFLPEGYDPDSYIKEHGQEEFRKKLERSMVLESFTFQYLKRGKKLDSPEDIRQIIFEIKKIIPAIRSETLKETLLQKFSAELNINKDLLLKADAPETKQVYKKQETIQKNNFENEFLLLIFIMENFGKTLDNEAADFFTFIQNCKNDEIDSLKEVLLAIRADDLSKKQTALFAKAMMIGLELTKDEAMSELIRVSDVIRLEYDDKFTDFLINLAKKKELTAERKENLQKLVNLRDNNSTQEEELIQFLNTYS
jgi:DNA primase|tara:strand:- start:2405 stop:4150 length:1746 start_codon:yes stop_codon:yes gene_type:complete